MVTENANAHDHPLGTIVRSFHTPLNAAADDARSARDEKPSQVVHVPTVSLTPANLLSPALLVGKNLEILWRNRQAEQELFLVHDDQESRSRQRNLLDWLCGKHFSKHVINWRQWVRFFLQHAAGLATEDELREVLDGLAPAHQPIVHDMLESQSLAFSRDVFSGRIRQVRANGALTSFWVVATDFDQGRLFVFDTLHSGVDEPGLAMAAEIEQKLEIVRQSPQKAVQSTVHILAARLHKADTLRTEMLADEYGRLLNRLWQKSIQIIERHGGIVAQDGDAGLLGHFLSPGEHDRLPLAVIECALALKSQMVELGREWKIRKGWLHDLELNIGIHSDEEHLGLFRSSVGENLALFGRSLKVSSLLARMGVNGQIWATKPMINKLTAEDLKRLRFGVFRQNHQRQVFIARCFSRIRDLDGTPEGVRNEIATGDMQDLAVTQVFDLQS